MNLSADLAVLLTLALIPYLALFLFLVARSRLLVRHHEGAVERQQRAFDQYIQLGRTRTSLSDELIAIAALHAAGVLSHLEYTEAKRIAIWRSSTGRSAREPTRPTKNRPNPDIVREVIDDEPVSGTGDDRRPASLLPAPTSWTLACRRRHVDRAPCHRLQ